MSTVNDIVNFGRRAFFEGNLQAYSNCVRDLALAIKTFADQDQVDLAIQLEAIWYNSLVKLIESEENYHSAFSWHTKSLWDAGSRRRVKLLSGDDSRLCFVIPNGVLLGHTQVMLEIIRSWQRECIPVTPMVLSLTSFDSKLANALDALSVRFFSPPISVKKLDVLAAWCREVITREGCGTAIWVSVPTVVSYLFGFQVAPKQVFWSLKFHPVHLGRSVTHIAMTPPGAGEVQFHGKKWKRFSPPLSVPKSSTDRQTVQNLRRRLGPGFIFGALARTEKFNSNQYVNAVLRIIKKCPGSVFVYTGREDSPVITARFRAAGLQSALRYVGWVDTDVYARALDVFLETFPFGCGITGAQAINAGTRTISLWCNETLPHYYFESYLAAKTFCSNWLVEETVSDYIARAEECFAKGQIVNDYYSVDSLAELDSEKAIIFFNLLRE